LDQHFDYWLRRNDVGRQASSYCTLEGFAQPEDFQARPSGAPVASVESLVLGLRCYSQPNEIARKSADSDSENRGSNPGLPAQICLNEFNSVVVDGAGGRGVINICYVIQRYVFRRTSDCARSSSREHGFATPEISNEHIHSFRQPTSVLCVLRQVAADRERPAAAVARAQRPVLL
jgi:hypothetical protein